MDASITKLKQSGLIYLWKFNENSRNYPGWNISFDNQGDYFLLQLLELMNTSEWSSKRLLKVTGPTDDLLKRVNNLNGLASWSTAKNLQLQFKKNQKNLWKISNGNQLVNLSFGPDKLIEIQNAITNKAFDIGIADSNDENIINFWLT